MNRKVELFFGFVTPLGEERCNSFGVLAMLGSGKSGCSGNTGSYVQLPMLVINVVIGWGDFPSVNWLIVLCVCGNIWPVHWHHHLVFSAGKDVHSLVSVTLCWLSW